MTIHIKTALILLITLALGTILGVLINGAIMRERLAPIFVGPPSPDRFAGMFERIVEPKDETQREAIRRILSNYAPRIAETNARHRMEMAALIDSLHQALRPVLTEDQLKRLDERRMPEGQGLFRSRRMGPREEGWRFRGGEPDSGQFRDGGPDLRRPASQHGEDPVRP
jgi:hypothetical protein